MPERLPFGISADENGGLTIDASKIRNKVVVYALMELKAGPKRDAYLDFIPPHLSQDSYNAAVSRLAT